jgi:hypothetical protein
MEDGCSKRFDIGTLDIRGETYDNMNHNSRPIGHLIPHPGTLPPMSVSLGETGGLLAPVQPPTRSRGMGPGLGHGHDWTR